MPKMEPRLASASELVTPSLKHFSVPSAIIDRCLQVFGGHGYMMEYPIAQVYAAARVQKIWGGTNEIVKELIGRSL